MKTMKSRLSANFMISFACLAWSLSVSCERKKNTSVASQQEVKMSKDVKIEGTNGIDTDSAPPPKANDFPLFYGYGKRVVASDSSEFTKVVEMIHSLEGGDLHQVLFLIELDRGGFEAQTLKANSTYGWDILLKFDENGSPSILKQEYWRH